MFLLQFVSWTPAAPACRSALAAAQEEHTRLQEEHTRLILPAAEPGALPGVMPLAEPLLASHRPVNKRT